MAELLDAPAQSVVIGRAATEAALKRDKRVATVRVLPSATNGLLPNELNGRDEPALVMTPSDSTDKSDDGLFKASKLSISAEWVDPVGLQHRLFGKRQRQPLGPCSKFSVRRG